MRKQSRWLTCLAAVAATAGCSSPAAPSASRRPLAPALTRGAGVSSHSIRNAAAPSPATDFKYHGGPLILGTTNVYYIWYGNWTQAAKNILIDLASSIGGSDYYGINTTYYDGSGGVVNNAVHYAGAIDDLYSHGKSLSDADVGAIVDSATSNGLPTDANAVYFVLTASDVTEHGSSAKFCTDYCGWHLFRTTNGSTLKYAFIGNPTACPSACEAQTVGPNGDAAVDAMASVVAHELEEAVTDPTEGGWYGFDSSGNSDENADQCAWTFGSEYTTANGALANMHLGNRDFLIQQNWVNLATGGFCETKLGFDYWEQLPGVKAVAGDFNHDGIADVALTGVTGWTTVPVAFSDGSNTLRVTNRAPSDANFPFWASLAGVKAVAGDFDNDGKTDIALLGAAGWTTMPMAFSNGDGTFRVTDLAPSNPDFMFWATVSGAKPIVGDFNGDGKADIALTGGTGWSTVPVAFSRGDGTFLVTNLAPSDANFPSWATVAGAQAVAGDFNNDGKADIVLAGGTGWSTVPVAFSNGDGTFRVTDLAPSDVNFGVWAATAGAQVVAGDFDHDGKADLALTGAPGWTTIAVAFSNGDGSFRVTDLPANNFPFWASVAGAKAVSGDFNHDGRADLALVGGYTWTTVPVAFSNGDGSFSVTNRGF